MQAKLATAVLLGFVLIGLAACGGSGKQATIDELEADLVAAEEARDEAQEARDEAQERAVEAEQQRQEEEAARKEAEEEAAEAEQQRQEEEAARQVAEAAAQEAEDERQAAEAERQRLATEAEERRKADATERARTAIAGHTATTEPLGTLVVGAIEYGEPAPVTTPPGPFTTSMGRSGRWSTTSLTANREPTRDTVEIYSDVEAPTRSPFATSDFNPTNSVIDGTGMVVGHVDISADHSRVAASGAFPRTIGDPVPFRLVDRGLTETQYGTGPTDADTDGTISDTELEAFTPSITRQQYNQYRVGSGFRDDNRFPQRYAYETSGTLQGASGRYRCDGDAATDSCTVQNRGGSFAFAGDWDFIPSSGTVQIVVPDGQYMWFGVWARQTVRLDAPPDQPTELWRFEAHHGGHVVTTLTDATGSATYRGPAAGRYAVYEPDTGESGIGSFTASATLQADFDANTVSGTITGFSNDSGWSLALKRSAITGGGAGVDTAGVAWTIDGVPDDSGAWEADFYTNLEVEGSTNASRTVTYQPHGIAGTFEAAYDPSGVGARAAVIGAFGAHR